MNVQTDWKQLITALIVGCLHTHEYIHVMDGIQWKDRHGTFQKTLLGRGGFKNGGLPDFAILQRGGGTQIWQNINY